jgi:hypothetical protein
MRPKPMANLPIIQTALSPKVKRYADKISTAWQKAVDGILSVSQLLKDAENELNSVEQMDLYEELPFSKSTADKLLSIANDKRLNDPNYKKYLPPHWTTLYEMTQLDDKTFKEGISQGLINPAVERRHILELTGQTLVVAKTAVKQTQQVIHKTQNTAKLATISIPKGFDISQVGSFQRDIEKLVLKYGGELKFDKSKKGVIGKQREQLAEWCIGELGKRKKTYTNLSPDEVEVLETTLSQLKRDRNGKPLLDYKKDPKTGNFQSGDIRNPKHPYYGKNLKEVYDHIRSNKILTKHSGLKEIDKEAHCIDLLRQHSQGNARGRADAIIKLTRLVKRGDEDTLKYARVALDQMIVD